MSNDLREPVGLSELDAAVYRHLVSHVATEADAMSDYLDFARSTRSRHVAFVTELIAQDEARHHRLYQKWADSIAAWSRLETDPNGVPDLHAEDEPDVVVARTERLLDFERNDLVELKDLEKKIKYMRDTTLWGLLIEMMRSDTEKHIRMLEFVRDHARRTARAARSAAH